MANVELLNTTKVNLLIHRLLELHDLYGKDRTFEFTTSQRVFVVWKDNNIVALAVLCMPHGYCWLRNFIVDKPYRGRGYQKLLILNMLQYAQSKKIKTVTTAVDQMNVWSLNNFIACGFKFVAGGKKHDGHLYQKLQIQL